MDTLNIYRQMLKIRLVEEKISSEYHNDEMKTPMHLYIGQEAIAVGVCNHLKNEDMVFSNHRSHGHFIAKGGNLKAMFAEFFCREHGSAKGYGGSMHLIDKEHGLPGASAIVGGGIPIAVGAAFSFHYRKKKNLSVVFFGDGAADEGVLYESINFAVLHHLPVLFVCENNEWSVASYHLRRQKIDIFNRFKNIIPSVRIDGNDVELVNKTAEEMINKIHHGEGPSFMECLTFRMNDHCGADPNPSADRQTLESWREKCPVKNYRKKLMDSGILNSELDNNIHHELNTEIEEAFDFGRNDVFPKKNRLLDMVFSYESP